jgi:hypothetical protein
MDVLFGEGGAIHPTARKCLSSLHMTKGTGTVAHAPVLKSAVSPEKKLGWCILKLQEFETDSHAVLESSSRGSLPSSPPLCRTPSPKSPGLPRVGARSAPHTHLGCVPTEAHSFAPPPSCGFWKLLAACVWRCPQPFLGLLVGKQQRGT